MFLQPRPLNINSSYILMLIRFLFLFYYQVCDLEKSVFAGRKVEDKDFVVLTELLMMELLKLDGIEAEGEARAQRKAEVQWPLYIST